MIHESRIKLLNREKIKPGKYVLYWMQQSQRSEYNHALEYTIDRANAIGLPVVVLFVIASHYPEANARHYTFMLDGIRALRTELIDRGISFIIRQGKPPEEVYNTSVDAALLITDAGYTKIQQKWRADTAKKSSCQVIQVESDAIVPVDIVSQKEEYSAGTFRPKIMRNLFEYLQPLKKRTLINRRFNLKIESLDIDNPEKIILRMKNDHRLPKVKKFIGGSLAAKTRLNDFIITKLDKYSELHSDPAEDYQSYLSPYLHFGQISPLYIALKIMESNSPCQDAFLEQLIIRRELAVNFVNFNSEYDSFESLPIWAKKTLKKHAFDKRDYIYSISQLESAKTHDLYWNAAQREMIKTGMMHNYMRMYWGKKIIEWTQTPEEAFENMLYLNNKYFLDGRDPNSFTGVAWCFGKHDRAWAERRIFGKVRFMNSKGLERKFDINKYVANVAEM